MKNNTVITDNTDRTTAEYLRSIDTEGALIVTDANVERLCLPRIACLRDIPRVTITPGEEHKTLASAEQIWEALERVQARRNSLLINVGGGLITDLGGFAASCYKRGIRFLNISTTLLADVDASSGGKTGVNFGGLKNQIGVFSWPEATIIGTDMLDTLPQAEVLSGYGEMLKTGYIADASLVESLEAVAVAGVTVERLRSLIGRCTEIKRSVVEADPKESGLRKILNFGHTAGHAFESLLIKRGTPLPHGICVVYGMMTALILSHIRLGLPSEILSRHARLLRATMPAIAFTCDDYPALLGFMHSDKKNDDTSVRFTLLRNIADPVTAQSIDDEKIRTSLDITRDYLGI